MATSSMLTGFSRMINSIDPWRPASRLNPQGEHATCGPFTAARHGVFAVVFGVFGLKFSLSCMARISKDSKLDTAIDCLERTSSNHAGRHGVFAVVFEFSFSHAHKIQKQKPTVLEFRVSTATRCPEMDAITELRGCVRGS